MYLQDVSSVILDFVIDFIFHITLRKYINPNAN